MYTEEQNECLKGTRWIDVRQYMDQQILITVKTLQKNVAIAWIDNKKVNETEILVD